MAYPGQISTKLCVVTLLMIIVDLAVARSDPDGVPRPEIIQSSPFNEEEIDELVDWHNFARSSVNPSASNMEYVQWDTYLQDIAQRWADNCLWEHGQPSDVPRHYGQNMWAIAHPGQVKPEAIVSSWDDEKHFYNLSANACKEERKCGHYTQVVWSTTNSIGCGRTFCPKLKGARKNMWIVVCQYSPPGNVVGYSPYVEGPPCSRCSSGVGQCYENLCRPCQDHDEECVCRQVCRNCGKVDESTCTCNCPGGFHGADCSKTCSDLHQYCGSTPGFPNRAFCRFHPMIPRLCPKMCGVCSPPDNLECVETTTVQTTEVKTASTPVYGHEDGANDSDVETSTVYNDKRSNMHNPMVA